MRMQCQNCGQDNVDSARFCKTCGKPLAGAPVPVQPFVAAPTPEPPAAPVTDLPPYVAPPAPVAPAQPATWSPPAAQSAAWSPPAAQPYAPASSTRVLRKVSPVSVLKVVAIIYGLFFALFGCLFFLLPGIIGGGLLSDLGIRSLGSGGILVTVLVYVLGVLVAGGIAGLSAAIAAVIYNVAARYVGGVEVEIDVSP